MPGQGVNLSRAWRASPTPAGSQGDDQRQASIRGRAPSRARPPHHHENVGIFRPCPGAEQRHNVAHEENQIEKSRCADPVSLAPRRCSNPAPGGRAKQHRYLETRQNFRWPAARLSSSQDRYNPAFHRRRAVERFVVKHDPGASLAKRISLDREWPPCWAASTRYFPARKSPVLWATVSGL